MLALFPMLYGMLGRRSSKHGSPLTAAVGVSGATFTVVTPAAVQSIGSGAVTASINGGSPITLTNPLWGSPTSSGVPYAEPMTSVSYTLPSAVASTDIVTWSADTGAYTTTAGATPAAYGHRDQSHRRLDAG